MLASWSHLPPCQRFRRWLPLRLPAHSRAAHTCGARIVCLLADAGGGRSCIGYPTAPLAVRCAWLAQRAPSRRVQMSRICDITGKRANNANRVTFSNKKNARLQHVNLQTKRFFSPELNRNVKLKVATSTMRTITKLGLDETAKKFGVDLSKF